MKAIGYARWSPRPRDTDSTAKQESDIRAWCEREGHELLQIYSDPDTSGTVDWMNRPGLRAAIESLRPGYVLVARNLDRLARGALGIGIDELIHAGGARLALIESGGLVGNSDEEIMGRGVMYLVADYQRKQGNKRTSRVMQNRQSNGQRMSRYAPAGSKFAADGKTIVPDDAELQAAERATELRHSGLSLAKIGQRLQAEGFVARSYTPGFVSLLLAISSE